MPCFEKLQDDDRAEYEPPYWLRRNGAFFLSNSDFNAFKPLVPEFSKLTTIKKLTVFEALLLYKRHTPHRMFGDFSDFKRLRKKHVLRASDLDLDEITAIIEQKLFQLETAPACSITALTQSDKIISLYLNDREKTEWQAICLTENGYELLLGGIFKLTST